MDKVFRQRFQDASAVFFAASMAFSEGHDFRASFQDLGSELWKRSELPSVDLSVDQIYMEFATLSFVLNRMRDNDSARQVNEKLYASHYKSSEEMFLEHESLRAECDIDLSKVRQECVRSFDFYQRLVEQIQESEVS